MNLQSDNICLRRSCWFSGYNVKHEMAHACMLSGSSDIAESSWIIWLQVCSHFEVVSSLWPHLMQRYRFERPELSG